MFSLLAYILYHVLCFAFRVDALPLEPGQTDSSISLLSTQRLLSSITRVSNGTISTLPTSSTSSPAPPTTSSNAPTSTKTIGSIPSSSGAPPGGGDVGGIPTGTTTKTAIGGSIAGFAILSLLVWWILKRKKNAKAKNQAAAAGTSVVEEKKSTPANSTATAEGVGNVDRAKERVRGPKRAASL